LRSDQLHDFNMSLETESQPETSKELTSSEEVYDKATSKPSSEAGPGDAVDVVTHSVSWITYQVINMSKYS
jgi:hypothetical protein